MQLSIAISLTRNLSYGVFPKSFHALSAGYGAHSEEFSEKMRRHSTDHKLKLDNAYWQVESAFQM